MEVREARQARPTRRGAGSTSTEGGGAHREEGNGAILVRASDSRPRGQRKCGRREAGFRAKEGEICRMMRALGLDGRTHDECSVFLGAPTELAWYSGQDIHNRPEARNPRSEGGVCMKRTIGGTNGNFARESNSSRETYRTAELFK